MAEERLIDDDKDRKYKIRKNEDGEDELYIDDAEEEEEPMDFEVPDFAYDDESVTDLTPEQYKAAMEAREREAREREERLAALTLEVTEGLAELDYARVLTAADSALEEYGDSGFFYCAKLRAITKDFTDYTYPDEVGSAAEGVQECADEEAKAALFEAYGQRIGEETERRKGIVAALEEENESKKEERRSKFVPAKKRAAKLFAATIVPFLVFLTLGIVFASVMLSRQDGLFMVLAAVFGALALVFAALSVATARGFVQTSRYVRLNERDTSTGLGRSLIAEQRGLDLLKRVGRAISPDNQ